MKTAFACAICLFLLACNDRVSPTKKETGGRFTIAVYGGDAEITIRVITDGVSGCEYMHVDGYKSGAITPLSTRCEASK